ncbi:MAG: right-handed parallel beta-helix repeat-containing protein, partial [Blastocatellia bacterium]
IGPSGVRDPSNAEGIDSIGSVGILIRGCYIHDSATNGIYLKGGARNGLIEGCRVERTHGYAGIILGQDTDLEFMRDGTKYEAIDCVARNNIVAHTGAAGLGTYSGLNIRFENNTLYDVAREIQAGFWVVTNSRGVPAEQVTFVNNIVVINSGRPFLFVKDLADKLVADGNVYYSPIGKYEFRREISSKSSADQWTFGTWRRSTGADNTSVTADPKVNASDLYRPLPDSPAMGHGVAVANAKDFAGAPRPRARCTIGAWEQGQKDFPAAR